MRRALVLALGVAVVAGSSPTPQSPTFIYSAGRGKAGKSMGQGSGSVANSIISQQPIAAAGTNSFQTAYVEPRGDYAGGGGYGGSGGGWGGGGGGGGGGIYHYAIHPHGGGGGGGGYGGGWGGPPMYYHEDEGGLEKGLLGLLGLGGLGGLKGLLGLAALLKLLLPLLLLFLPLLLPLLLAKAALLFALLLLIPVPVITPGRSISGKEGEGKALIQDTLGDIMSKIPGDLNHIISKIKDSDWFRGAFPKPEKKAKGKGTLKTDLSSNAVFSSNRAASSPLPSQNEINAKPSQG